MAAVAGGGGLAEALAFLAAAAGRGVSYRPALTARAGGLLFLWFHRVDVAFEVSNAAGAVADRLQLSLAVLGGTMVVTALMAVGGRSVASAALARGSTPKRAALLGSKVALPYSALCLLVAVASRTSLVGPGLDPGATITARAGLVAAGLWPLGLGLVAGLSGGLWAVRRAVAGASWERRARAATAGAWRMRIIGLALSFAGLLALGAVHPDATRRYFRTAFDQGPVRGSALLALTASVAPNMSAWLLTTSMGSCLSVKDGRSTTCVVSYEHLVTSEPGAIGGLGGVADVTAAPAGSAPAPRGYLLFLAVPVVATVLGGVRAARRARPASRAEALGVGAAAGALFGSLSFGLVLLASISGRIVGALAASRAGFRIGPDLPSSVILALAWGVAGGALGGLARGPEPATEAAIRDGASEPEASPPP